MQYLHALESCHVSQLSLPLGTEAGK